MKTKKKHKGLHTHRLDKEPLEALLSIAWQQLNDDHQTLDYLLGDGRTPADPSDRDREVAATVVQWLGSPVGQGFLRGLGFTNPSDND